MAGYYILNGHKAVPCKDVMKWAKSLEIDDRRVAEDCVGDVRISTVFLGLDHSHGDDPPMLFETMVFGGMRDEDMSRYSTWEEAEEGHKQMVDKVKASESAP